MLALSTSVATAIEPYGPSDAEINIVVLDPTTPPLACEGADVEDARKRAVALRSYEHLADYLRESTGKTIRVAWSRSVAAAVTKNFPTAELVIGPESIVLAEAKSLKRDWIRIAHLTDKQGSTKQRGLFVVLRANKAKTLLDLDGYRVIFGNQECDERSAAALKLLSDTDVDYGQMSRSESNASAVAELLQQQTNQRAAAVLSSYSLPMLESCGAVPRGALKVVGETSAVPFITVFAAKDLPADTRQELQFALIEMSRSKSMLDAMESKSGFVAAGPSE